MSITSADHDKFQIGSLKAKHSAEKAALETEIEDLKGRHEYEIISMRQEHGTKRTSLEAKASQNRQSQMVADKRAFKAEERTTKAEERTTKAEERTTMAEERTIKAEERASAAEMRTTKAEERATQAEQRVPEAEIQWTSIIYKMTQIAESNSKHQMQAASSFTENTLSLEHQAAAPDLVDEVPSDQAAESVDAQQCQEATTIELHGPMEPDAECKQCPSLNQELLQQDKHIRHMQEELAKANQTYLQLQFKVEQFRVSEDQNTGVIPSAEYQTNLDFKEHRYQDLLRAYNTVLGYNVKLEGRVANLKEQHKEEIHSKDVLQQEVCTENSHLIDSRDRWRKAHDEKEKAMLKKLMPEDIDELMVKAWAVAKHDTKVLCEKVIWLKKLLKDCNKHRLQLHKERITWRQIAVRTTQKHARLLEYKRYATGRLEHLRRVVKKHVPGCKHKIDKLRIERDSSKAQLVQSDKRHAEQMMHQSTSGERELIQYQKIQISAYEETKKEYEKEIFDLQDQVEADAYLRTHEVMLIRDHHQRMEDAEIEAEGLKHQLKDLKEILAQGDARIGDPEHWVRYEACSKWKAHGEIIVREHEAREKEIIHLFHRLWERMFDFEHQAEYYNQEDPDDTVEKGRGEKLKRRFKKLFLRDIDDEVERQLDLGPKEDETGEGGQQFEKASETDESAYEGQEDEEGDSEEGTGDTTGSDDGGLMYEGKDDDFEGGASDDDDWSSDLPNHSTDDSEGDGFQSSVPLHASQNLHSDGHDIAAIDPAVIVAVKRGALSQAQPC